MYLGYDYWIILWITMGIAFLCAWLFLIKGCETMDAKTEIDPDQEPEVPGRIEH